MAGGTSGTDAVAAAAPVVDAVAVALTGAYGVERAGSMADRLSGLPSSPAAPGIGAAASINAGAQIGVANESNGQDAGKNPTSGGSGGQLAASPTDISTFGASSVASAAGLPGTLGAGTAGLAGTPVPELPIAGVNGVVAANGAIVTTGAPIDRGSDSTAAASPISDQVAAQIGRQLQGARMFRDGTHHTVLRLSPEHLGEVTITLDVRAGGIRLDLAAAPQALAALQADLGQLRDDLANSGLDLGDVTLSAQNPGPGTNGQGAARERWQESAPAERGPAGKAPADSATTAPALRTGSDRLRNGGLDVLA